MFLLAVLIFITAFMCCFTLLIMINSEKEKVRLRLEAVQSMGKNLKDRNYVNEELKEPLVARFFKPLIDGVKNIFMKIIPVKSKEDIEKKLILAGYPMNMDVKAWIFFRTILAVALPCITFVLAFIINGNLSTALLMNFMVLTLALIFPNMMLKQRINQRQYEIRVALPDIIDLLTVSVEAGLSFDGALSRVVEKTQGPLADEFKKALQEIRVGRSRIDALKDVGTRTGVNDLKSFIGALIQADKLGVGIGNVLRIQSIQMRQKRRQRAEESAMKAPIKMLFPLILFIFPTMFIVLLGPALIIIIEMFM